MFVSKKRNWSAVGLSASPAEASEHAAAVTIVITKYRGMAFLIKVVLFIEECALAIGKRQMAMLAGVGRHIV